MKGTAGLIISLGLVATLTLAQGRPDPLEACYQQPDGAPRLACFNKEMQRRQAAAAAGAGTAPAPAAAPTVSAKKPADDNVGLQGSDLRRKLKAQGVQPELVRPIVAKVIRMVPRSHSETAFELDNGQTWQQAELVDNLDVRLQDTVTIKPGALGAFFLNTPRSQRVRVHRIL